MISSCVSPKSNYLEARAQQWRENWLRRRPPLLLGFSVGKLFLAFVAQEILPEDVQCSSFIFGAHLLRNVQGHAEFCHGAADRELTGPAPGPQNGALQVLKRRAEAKVVENPLDSKAPAILRPVAPNGTALAKEA